VDVTVVVASYGDPTYWLPLADRAAKSVPPGVPVVRVHQDDATLAQVRNAGLAHVATEWVVFLDADDELTADYFDQIGEADVQVTAISYSRDGRTWTQPRIPKVWAHDNGRGHDGPCEPECLPDGNYVHIGAILRTEKVREIGGFAEWPVYEDYDAFLRLWRAGATFENRPDIVYRAHQDADRTHRNKSLPIRERNQVHRDIVAGAAQ